MTVAWLFPGQGSQSVGMGRDILDASPAARAVFERADAALADVWQGGGRLSKLVLEGPEEVLTLTANAQPALVATSCAILEAIRERVPDASPAFAAGHSLGEYSALVAAEALMLEDALRLVRSRGQAMQAAVAAGTGAMSAIMGVDAARLGALCSQAVEGHPDEVVAPANFNAPGQWRGSVSWSPPRRVVRSRSRSARPSTAPSWRLPRASSRPRSTGSPSPRRGSRWSPISTRAPTAILHAPRNSSSDRSTARSGGTRPFASWQRQGR